MGSLSIIFSEKVEAKFSKNGKNHAGGASGFVTPRGGLHQCATGLHRYLGRLLLLSAD